MTARAALGAAVLASTVAALLGALAAWPIYRSPWLLLTLSAGLVLGSGLGWLAGRRDWSPLMTMAALCALLLVTVVPAAVPQAWSRGPLGLLSSLPDAVAAIALGWKQLLTLTLPVGSYQTVLVPAYVVALTSSALAVTLALRRAPLAPLAALPLLAPVVFGTVFGASELGEPLRFGPLLLIAPRESALWIAAGTLGALWVSWSSGAARRAALRRGRPAGSRGPSAREALLRGVLALTALLLAGGAAAAIAPAFERGARAVPRDHVDPAVLLRERASPLAAYRLWKQDPRFDVPIFEARGDPAPPERLRLAVLDAYDGVDFHVGAESAGRFSRYPSGTAVASPRRLSVTIGEGYADIWAPIAVLGEPPEFHGPRAARLADAFYVDRDAAAAISVPGGGGLAEGDGYEAVVSGGEPPPLAGRPRSPEPRLDLESMPELAAWVQLQDLPATGPGLAELVDRLRSRGYLSHALSQGDVPPRWLVPLADRYGTRFEPSPAGHSVARIELIFSQLHARERLAGSGAPEPQLVAAVGDDEQFATAAALLARALGFESRVVLGVRLGSGVPGVPACEERCTGEHLGAWIEVRGEGDGWTPLDATPQAEHPPLALEEGEQLPAFPTVPEERDAREVDPPLGIGEGGDAADDRPEREPVSWVWPAVRAALLALTGAVLIALPLLFLPLAKRLRRRRRRRERDPELRALGAWQELVDRAADAGTAIPRETSRTEAAARLGTERARWMAGQVDRAVFSASGIRDADAEWLWRALDAELAERRARQTPGQRLRAAYALRSYGVRFGGWRARGGESAPVQRDREQENRANG